jgi:hypothetical protein
VSTTSPRRLLLFVGAVARARVARLALLAEQSAIWRVNGREVEIERLMLRVMEEVEDA